MAAITTIAFEIPLWLAQAKGLSSTRLEGEIVEVSARALRISGSALVAPSARCGRCHRVLTDPVSIELGYGPECFGADLRDNMTAEEKREYIERFRQTATFNDWFPRRYLKVDGEIPESPKRPQSIRLTEGRILAFTHYENKERCRQLGGRWDPAVKAWTWEATGTTAFSLLSEFGDELDEIDEGVRELAATLAAAQASKTDITPEPVPSKTKPWLHQAQAFHFASQLPAAMLAMEMGTGKSKVAVDLINAWDGHLALILCPLSVVGVWPREFERHSLAKYRVVPLRGSVPEKLRQAVAVTQANEERLVIALNYESAWREPLASWLLQQPWDVIVFDESHRLKSPTGKASRFCRSFNSKSRRLALTGTPMPHDPGDIWAQYRLLDPQIFGPSYFSFLRRYAIMGGYQGREVVAWRTNLIKEKMAPIAFRVSKNVLDLPPEMHEVRTVQLDGKQQSVYERVQNEICVWLSEQESVSVSMVLTQLLRLQQVTSGFVATDQGGVVEIGDAKEEALRDIITDAGASQEPVVVFCRFQHDLDVVRRVAEKLHLRYGELSGRRRDALDEKACMAENVDVAGVQIQAGGVGVDLTRARYCVYYSLGFSMGDYEQSLARVHRPGQVRPVTYYHIVAEGTVDEAVYGALSRRKDLVESALGFIGGGNVRVRQS